VAMALAIDKMTLALMDVDLKNKRTIMKKKE